MELDQRVRETISLINETEEYIARLKGSMEHDEAFLTQTLDVLHRLRAELDQYAHYHDRKKPD